MDCRSICDPRRPLADAQIKAFLAGLRDEWDVTGRRVLLVVPDHTRTCRMDLLFPPLYELLAGRARSIDVLIALGTHPPLSDDRIRALMGITAGEQAARYAEARFFNHLWREPSQLADVGRLDAGVIREATGGLFEMDVNVACNRMVLDHDLAIMVGPVFPHEVAGFSGGNKYLVPGIAGREIIDFFHWLGAVITNPEIIGRKRTAVRRVIDAAAAMAPLERKAICVVVRDNGLAGLYAGSPEDAWSAAADLSARLHIEFRDRQYHTVLSCAPPMYEDLWTGGKCMYKVEPVVSDGGRVIIYAPHIREISPVHGALLGEIGYHTRDYFLAQWDKFKGYPWGVLAHSTNVRGVGTYENGIERPRIEVILATGIAEDTCRRVNLGYLDPAKVRKQDFEGREEEGILIVHKAGEVLYRTRG